LDDEQYVQAVAEVIDQEIALPDLLAERDRLREVNAELLSACKILVSLNDETIEEHTDHVGKTGTAVSTYMFNSMQYDILVEAFEKARAAIANATRKEV
jgi:hypothetical protein